MHATRTLATCLLVLVAGPGSAQPDTPDWTLDGASLAAALRSQPYLAWNPRDPAASNRPGLKLAFFGGAPFCAQPQGELAELPAGLASRVQALSGLGSGAGVQAWSPEAGASCGAQRGQRDDSFIAIDASGPSAGAGLYTGTGPDTLAHTGFFGPFGQQGQTGDGANAGIEGSFLTMRLDWRSPQAPRPWAAGPRAVLRLDTVQSLSVLRVPGATAPRPTQAKQQLTLGLINADCMAERGAAARPCQLKLLLTTAIGRSAVADWSAVPWFQRTRVLFDRAQGGIPVIDSGLPAAGSAMRTGPGGRALFESTGAATQHAPFGDTRFGVRMRWSQFEDALREVAGSRQGQPAARVGERELVSLFGERWDEPGAWVLLSVSVGQEVSTPDARRPAAIGGAVRSVRIGADRGG